MQTLDNKRLYTQFIVVITTANNSETLGTSVVKIGNYYNISVKLQISLHLRECEFISLP
jgi:hypothetical protein